MTQEELKKVILEYLEKNRRMTLATASENIPWAATVMFAYDTNLNFYFISNPETRKIKNLEANPQISCAINEFKNKAGSTMGIQIGGMAEQLDKTKHKKELEIFRKRFDWADDYLHDHELFKIKPSKIIYLDDEKFGPGGKQELNLN